MLPFSLKNAHYICLKEVSQKKNIAIILVTTATVYRLNMVQLKR